MAKIAEVQEVSRTLLRPYERNAKIHGSEQIEKIAKSIQEFGFVNPVLIDREYNVIAGHGRIMAAEKLGMDTVPCLYVEGLTEEQRRAYILADNRLAELAEWDFALASEELKALSEGGFDFTLTGFDEIGLADFDDEEKTLQEAQRYTGKTKIPQYEPTGEDVPIEECYDLEKTNSLIKEVHEALGMGKITEGVYEFLRAAAYRHAIFDYRRIAEFYSNADKYVQELFEKSALVIIDIDDAIANGYVKLSKTISDILEEVEE